MKGKLKLINSPNLLGEEATFWTCCPRLLNFLPTSACGQGKPEFKKGKIKEDPECPWWINSEKHNFCFWTYVHDKSDANGVLPEVTKTELAKLFGWSPTKTHFLVKEAIAELSELLIKHSANDLSDESAESTYAFLNSYDLEDAESYDEID